MGWSIRTGTFSALTKRCTSLRIFLQSQLIKCESWSMIKRTVLQTSTANAIQYNNLLVKNWHIPHNLQTWSMCKQLPTATQQMNLKWTYRIKQQQSLLPTTAYYHFRRIQTVLSDSRKQIHCRSELKCEVYLLGATTHNNYCSKSIKLCLPCEWRTNKRKIDGLEVDGNHHAI